jgi:hypothetical protein
MGVNDILQYAGAVFGIIGGVLISWNTPNSKYGFIFATIASILLMWWCLVEEQWGYFVLNVVYFIIDLIGIYKWWDIRSFLKVNQH